MIARLPAVLAAAALSAAPAAAAELAPSRAAFSAGPDLASGATGLALRADGGWDVASYGGDDRTRLGLAVSLGWTRFAEEGRAGATDLDASTSVLRLVPAARLSQAFGRRFVGYADAGLGVYRASTTLETSNLLGTTRTETGATGVALRLGSGVGVEVARKVRAFGEVAYAPHLGGFDETTVSLLVGASLEL